MKTSTHRTNCQGSALLLTLLSASVIGIALASYLTFVANQSRSTVRSLSWNSCVPVMEAGVEEALTHINYQGPNNLGTNGWALGADNLYHKTRWFGDSYCDVSIQPVDPPVIISAGYVPGPANPPSVAGMILSTVAGSTCTPTYARRCVQVSTVKQPGGAGGINSKGTVIFSGSGYLASYLSSTGPYVIGNRRANAVAISNGTVIKTIQVGTGKIYGTAITGPNGTVTYGAGGAVGDSAWIAGGNVGGETGHIDDDAAVTYTTPSAPFVMGTGFNPTSGTVSGYGATNFVYVLDGTVHQNWNINGNGSVSSGAQPMLVRGNVTLYVSGDMTVSGSGFIYVEPGANLNLYIGGKLTVSGSGVVNGTGLAKNVSAYGLSTTSGKVWTYSGSSDYIGTMYAPLASLVVSGGASAIGSFTANTFTLSGSGHIIYDENLSTGGSYVAASWDEL